MDSLVNFILNTLVVSIPEEFFIAYIILFLLKICRITNHQYLDIHENFRNNILRVFLYSVLPIALVSNVLLQLQIDNGLISVICLILMPISIICVSGKIRPYKYLFVILISLICMSLEAAIQAVSYKIIFSITLTNYDYFMNIESKKIVLTLLPRLIEYLSLIIIFMKSNLIIKTNIIQEFYRNKILLVILSISIIINSTMFITLFKVIIDKDILNVLQISKFTQVIITLIIFFCLCFSVFTLWIVPTIIQMNERYRNKYGRGLK